MDGIEDGGQAFPQPVTVGPNDDLYPAYPGMTLRDYFAGQAMAAIIAKSPYKSDSRAAMIDSGDLPARAAAAYEYADAMIAERGKETTP